MFRRARRSLRYLPRFLALVAVLLSAMPALGWSTRYRCLVTGDLLRECCCLEVEVVTDTCCSQPETTVGAQGEASELCEADPCDCCEILIDRALPTAPALKAAESDAASDSRDLGAAVGPSLASEAAARPSCRCTRVDGRRSRAGPPVRVLFSVLRN